MLAFYVEPFKLQVMKRPGRRVIIIIVVVLNNERSREIINSRRVGSELRAVTLCFLRQQPDRTFVSFVSLFVCFAVSFPKLLPIFISISSQKCGPLKLTWNVARPNNQPSHQPLQQINMAVQSLSAQYPTSTLR